MTSLADRSVSSVVVRLWAGAKAAAGSGELAVAVPGPVSVAWLRAELAARLPEATRLPAVLAACSVLVDEQPLGTADPAAPSVAPGAVVDFLPPFAGG